LAGPVGQPLLERLRPPHHEDAIPKKFLGALRIT
jgi:hypothetical protein